MKSSGRAKMSRIMSKAGFLPTIKCSNCALDVEISSMGEHICPKVPSQPATPPPDAGDNRTNEFNHGAGHNNDFETEGLWPKSGRSAPPPRIDPSAANHAFLRPSELTPASSTTGSRSLSPFSPYAARKSLNSASEPSPQAPPTPFGPPSPELENVDSSQRFNFSDNSNSAYPNSTDRDLSYAGMQVEENPYQLVKSRESKPGSRLRQQGPSPSISYGRPADESESNYTSHRRGMMSVDSRSSRSSYATSAASTRIGTSISRPSTAGSNHSSRPSLASISRGPRSHLDQIPPVPSTKGLKHGSYQFFNGDAAVDPSPPKREGGYGGFDWEVSEPQRSYGGGGNEADNARNQLYRSQTLPAAKDQSDPPNQLTRSQTFPVISDEASGRNTSQDSLSRIPLGNQATPEQYQYSTTSNNTYLQPTFSGRNEPEVPTPTYSPSVYGTGNDINRDTVNDFSTSDLSQEFGNPYDTTVDGPASSTDSSPSEAQSGSTASTSPPSESSVRRPRRQKSGMDISHKRHGTVVLDPPPGFFLGGPDSPTDPSFQYGQLSNLPPKSERSFSSDQERFEALKLQPPPVPPLPAEPRSPNTFSPPVRPSSAAGQQKRRCRGCKEPINGKSVSSSDGRLTGRYHKSCLVCHTCGSAFLTADLYVLHDHPYCSQHYHELNCSLCFSCNHGIEGQYLETDEWVPQSNRSRRHRQKFHPDCFRCKTCRIVLGGDYFEWNGEVYCERDARRVASQYAPPPHSPLRPPGAMSRRGRPPASPSSGMSRVGGPPSPAYPPSSMLGPGGPRFPERRTTRLMMT